MKVLIVTPFVICKQPLTMGLSNCQSPSVQTSVRLFLCAPPARPIQRLLYQQSPFLFNRWCSKACNSSRQHTSARQSCRTASVRSIMQRSCSSSTCGGKLHYGDMRFSRTTHQMFRSIFTDSPLFIVARLLFRIPW